MKRRISIISILFIAIFCITTTLFSQPNSINYECDTLQDGTLSYNLYTNDSSSILKSLVFPVAGTKNKVFTTSSSLPADDSFLYEDNFLKNISLPTDYGGCLPLDVCYNSTSNKYYIYGGLNVVVLDGTTLSKVDEIKVSNYFRPGYSSTWSTRGDNHLVYNSQYDKIFCTTVYGELVVIDCTTHEVLSTFNLTGMNNPVGTSIIIDNNGNYVYWFVNDCFIQNKVCKVG